MALNINNKKFVIYMAIQKYKKIVIDPVQKSLDQCLGLGQGLIEGFIL